MAAQAAPLKPDTVLQRFAFGGCNHQYEPQNFWPAVRWTSPQLWIWNGDIIYADDQRPPDRVREYALVKGAAGYEALRREATVLGTWDDHDFGGNNLGRHHPFKVSSQRQLMDFLDEPADSLRRQREGVYAAYTYGPPGRRAKFILLDERYFRDDPGPLADLLGQAQWDWLSKELAARDYQLLFLVSSTQVLPYQHGGEKWAGYPGARQRLLNLLSAQAAPVIVLSGDRHFAEISHLTLASGRELYEFTSSGLTHYVWRPFFNSLRVGSAYHGRNFGTVSIDWKGGRVDLEVRDIGGEVVSSVPVRWKR
jgi:alkaline phosphatase D